MTKSEFISMMQSQGGFDSKAETERALEGVLSATKKALANGEKVNFIGFGSFETSTRAARVGRNPQSGQPLHIPASNVVKFKPGKELKDAVNQH